MLRLAPNSLVADDARARSSTPISGRDRAVGILASGGSRGSVIAPAGQKDVRPSQPGRAGGLRLEPDNRAPGRARDKRNPTTTIGVEETDRARGKVAEAFRIAEARISPSARKLRQLAPPKSAFGGCALPPDWRIPPGEDRELSAEPLPTHTARTIQGLVRGRVRATPIWPPHCSPEQMCPASAISRGPRGSEAHCHRAAARRPQTDPIPSAGCSIAVAAPLRRPLFPALG